MAMSMCSDTQSHGLNFLLNISDRKLTLFKVFSAKGDVALITTHENLLSVSYDLAVMYSGIAGSLASAPTYGFNLFYLICYLHKP